MQSSTQALQQFKQALVHVYQQWRDKQWEMMNIKLELPLFDAPVCASFLQMGEETVLEICDDDWDQLVGNSLAEEDSYHMAVQASRRIMWRPFCAEEAEVALFQQDGLQVFINDIHCGLLEVRPSSRWIEETRMLAEALSEILAAYNGPETTDEQWVEAAQLSDQSWRLVPKEGAVRIEGPACMIDEAAADKLSQLKHTRETAQLDVISLIDPLEAEHGTAVAFRMLVLVCSNRHQTHIEFSFRKREDLCTALVEALREFILIAGIPARLQVNHGLYEFILADLAQRLGIRIVHVEHLILTEQLSEELAAALSPLATPESMN